MLSCARTNTQIATAAANSNDPPPSYVEAFNMVFIAPPSYNELFMSPVYASIFGSATSLTFINYSADYPDYSFQIRGESGDIVAKVNIGPIYTRVTDVYGMEIFKFSKADSDDLREQDIHAFEMRDKNMVSNTIKVTEKGRSIQIIHKYSDPALIVRSINIGQFAVFRGNSSTNPLCDVHITKSFKRREFSGSIKFHTETEISTLEQLLCTASAIALKIVMKEEGGKKCVFGRAVTLFVCFIIFVGIIALITHSN